jgi:hypothetical protein
MNEKFVVYEDFGAVGDGVTDDFHALRAAHAYANENGLPVKGTPGKKYLLHNNSENGTACSIIVRTDTDWQGAELIIDDSDIPPWDEQERFGKQMIIVESDYAETVIADRETLSRLEGIGIGTKRIDLALGYPALLILLNKEHRVFRRYGKAYGGQMLGAYQSELIVVDGEGNVDESTPFMFDYNDLSMITVIRTDVKPITVGNGIVTTVACRTGLTRMVDGVEKYYERYYARGLYVHRSHTTVKNVEHRIVGEFTLEEQAKGLIAPPYSGFFYGGEADEITFKDCILQGRRYYHVQGSYDFGGRMVNKIRLINCHQSNFYLKNENGETVTSMAISKLTGWRICWGIGGTNYCKNMEYIGCTLSRFDAHAGLINGKIIDTTINFIALTGKGDMEIRGTKLVNIGGASSVDRNFVYLRDDYGSMWQGTITLKDCEINTSVDYIDLFNFTFRNHDFGYVCHFPSAHIENLRLTGREDVKINLVNRYFFDLEPGMHRDVIEKIHHRDADFEEELDNFKNYNKTVTPEFIRFVNIPGNFPLHLVSSPFFDETELEGNIIRD